MHVITTEAAGRRAIAELQQALNKAVDMTEMRKSTGGPRSCDCRSRKRRWASTCKTRPLRLGCVPSASGVGCLMASFSTAATASPRIAPGPGAFVNWG